MSPASTEELIRKALSGRDGVQLVGHSKQISFDEKSKTRQPRRRSDSVENWITGDFATYIKESFSKRYNESWGLNFSSACNEFLQVRDAIADALGSCENSVAKDYIDYFFQNFADKSFVKEKGFFISQMRYEAPIRSFAANHKLEQAPKPKVHESKPNTSVNPATLNDDIERAFYNGDAAWVACVGIVVAVNWLVSRKAFSLRDAVKFVFQACHKAYANGSFNEVKKATESIGPYPSNLLFKDADRLAKMVNSALSVDVKIDDSAPQMGF